MTLQLDSLIIGLGTGIIAQRFFNVTDRIAKAIKNYQKAQKAKQTKNKSAESNVESMDSKVQEPK